MPESHPSTDLLAAFSAGTLSTAQSLCVSAHLEHCKACQAHLNNLNNLAGNLFEKQEKATVNSELKNKVFAMLDEQATIESNEIQPALKPSYNSVYPNCITKLLPENIESLPWKKLGKNIKTATLAVDSTGAKIELLSIKAGAAAATHTHRGEELTLVLDGSFSDEKGIYRKGDFLVCNENDNHRPVATKDKDCLCLTVTENPVHFTGLLWRFINPFYRRIYAHV